MVKLRENWPLSHDSSRIDEVKSLRESIVVGELFDCQACRYLQSQVEDMISVSDDGVTVLEGRAVKDLERYWSAWVDWARQS